MKNRPTLAALLLASAAALSPMARAGDAFDASTANQYLATNGYRTDAAAPKSATPFDVAGFRQSLKDRDGSTPYLYDDADLSSPKKRATPSQIKGKPMIGVDHVIKPGDAGLLNRLFPGINAGAVLAGKADLSPAQVDTLADYDVSSTLASLQNTLPGFSQYPADVQAALLDMRLADHSTGTPPWLASAAMSKWDSAADQWAGSQPRTSTSQAWIEGDTRPLHAFTQQQTADVLWASAGASAANADFPDPNLSSSLSGVAARRAFETLASTDPNGDAQFLSGRFVTPVAMMTVTPPSFTAAPSSGGLTDIVVAANSLFNFTLLDNGHHQDGDVVAVNLVNSSGTHFITNQYLLTVGTTFSEQIGTTAANLKLTSLSEGSLPPTTGGLNVTSAVISGNTTQSFRLTLGQSGVLRITPR